MTLQHLHTDLSLRIGCVFHIMSLFQLLKVIDETLECLLNKLSTFFCEFVRNYDLYYCKFATDKIFLVSNWRCTVSLVYHEFTNILTAVVIDTVVHSNLKQFLLPGS